MENFGSIRKASFKIPSKIYIFGWIFFDDKDRPQVKVMYGKELRSTVLTHSIIISQCHHIIAQLQHELEAN